VAPFKKSSAAATGLQWCGSRAATEATLECVAADIGEVMRPIGSKVRRRSAQLAMKAAEYKAKRRLFDRRRSFREKSMANPAKRAQGETMHNHSAAAEQSAKNSGL